MSFKKTYVRMLTLIPIHSHEFQIMQVPARLVAIGLEVASVEFVSGKKFKIINPFHDKMLKLSCSLHTYIGTITVQLLLELRTNSTYDNFIYNYICKCITVVRLSEFSIRKKCKTNALGFVVCSFLQRCCCNLGSLEWLQRSVFTNKTLFRILQGPA
jgi:hypothetical protein